ncbi:hypothetical protein HDV02_003047 [Globomyces sp. JEL0801]|nr:hypothetical protein HDV02_003047 [Globomyces sp. JEL0801]
MSATVVTIDDPALKEGNIDINHNSIRSVDLLKNKRSEQEFYDVQKSIRSAKELNLVSEQRNTRAIELVWSNITVKTLDGKKTLLEGATGKIKSRFLAIMGPSGSGKTTLMNTLKQRDSSHPNPDCLKTDKFDIYALGAIIINIITQTPLTNYWGDTKTWEAKRSFLAQYIRNQDLLKMVMACIHDNPDERPTATEMLHQLSKLQQHDFDPVVLRIEESRIPAIKTASGSKNASSLYKYTPGSYLLSELNLPSAVRYDIFETEFKNAYGADDRFNSNDFKNLVKPTANTVTAKGLSLGLLKDLDSLAHEADEEMSLNNFLDVITPSHHDGDKDDDALMGLYTPEKFDFKSDEDKRLEGYHNLIIHKRTSWLHQFRVLLERTWLDATRSYGVIITLLIQNIVIAGLIGGVFWQIGTGQDSAVKRSPALFFTVINQGVFAAMSVINSFPSERRLVLRERAAGTYHVSAYFLAKNLVDAAIQISGPIVFSSIVYFMVGFQPVASKFFIYMAFMILASFTSTSLALAISTFARTTTMSVTILPFVFELCRLYGGFFLSPSRLPKYFVWIDALSYVKYVYVGISLNEMQGLELSCTLADKSRCVTGANRIADLGLDYISIQGCAIVLISMIVIFRFLSYLGVRYVKW